MKAVILGSGGREYTIGWKLSHSKKIDKVYFIPGNGGTSELGENIDIKVDDFGAIADFIEKNKIELLVVGPEAPLVNGIVDFFEEKHIPNLKIIGPSQKGAMLEGSKAFSKKFMEKHDIPTATYRAFNQNQYDESVAFMKSLNPPYVLKADGLAAGKGVLILDDIEIAKAELKLMFEGKFGKAGKNVVIEEFMDGIELSVFVITDGKDYKILPEAKDYKRIGDGDKGLNTGGMGAVSPVPFADYVFMKKIEDKIIKPTIEGLQKDDIKYNGFIFFGLIKVDNEPYVIEYNARMGDPETQAVLPRVKTDFADLFIATAENKLNEIDLEIDDNFAVSVVLASGGYPESYEKNIPITGAEKIENGLIIHAGTKTFKNQLLTSGGRVMALTSFGNTLEEARSSVYKEIENISFDKMYYRKDIGLDLL